MTSKVLITGAAGFIGSTLWRCLGSSHEVVACVTTEPASYSPPPGRIYRFRLPNEELKHILAREHPDFVVHCAGGSSVTKSLVAPAADFRDSVTATDSLLEAVAASSPDTRVIFISSAAVYGNPVELPARETVPPLPISPYGYHKLMCEQICQKYYQLARIPTIILRVFSVFGPGLRKQVVWDIYQKWLESEVVTLSGTGDETRDWIYVDDLVRVIQLVMEKGEFTGEAVNVATGCEVTLRYFAASCCDALGGARSLSFTGELRPGDPHHWQADISRLQGLGFSNWISLEDGIHRYRDWLRTLEK